MNQEKWLIHYCHYVAVKYMADGYPPAGMFPA